MLDETAHGLCHVIDADVPQPVRRRATGRRLRRKRDDIDAFAPEAPAEEIAVEIAGGMDVGRSQLVVTEPFAIAESLAVRYRNRG